MLIKLKNFVLKNKSTILLGFILGMLFSFGGVVIAPDLSIKIFPYVTESGIPYERLTGGEYDYGISGLPFPSKTGCNYLSIQQGVFLNPSCEGTSVFGAFALVLNILFWILFCILTNKMLSFARKKRRYTYLSTLITGLIFFLLVFEFKTYAFRDFFGLWVFDNYHHHIPCDKLPQRMQVVNTLRKNEDRLKAMIIEASGSDKNISIEDSDQYYMIWNGAVSVGTDTNCVNTQVADITIYYGSSTQRKIIQKYLIHNMFEGIPVNLINN